MKTHSWIRNLFARPVTRPFRKAPCRARPTLESLEDRCVPSTLTVTKSGDDVTDHHTLRYAVAHAQSGDTIQITAAVKDPIVLINGELVVSQNVTIESVPSRTPTISGDGISRVFEIAAGANVTLENLDLIDGNGLAGNPSGSAGLDHFGGAILNLGTLTVSDSTLASNMAGSHDDSTQNFGGAIDNMGNLTLNNSTFSSNSAHQGGAIENTGTLVVTNSTFSANTASSLFFVDRGGAIDNSGPLTVTNSTFTNNDCDNQGGAIYNSGTATVTGCTFTGNTVPFGFAFGFGGGGIDNTGTLTVTGSTFTGNSASGGGDGGGILNLGTVSVGTSNFSGNSPDALANFGTFIDLGGNTGL
jgi:predicted outer membrane repeat protein